MTQSSMRERAAKVADIRASASKMAGDNAQSKGSGFRFNGTVENVHRLAQHQMEECAAAIRALPVAPDPTRDALPEWDDVPNEVRAMMISAAFKLVGHKDNPGAREWYIAMRLALNAQALTTARNALGTEK